MTLSELVAVEVMKARRIGLMEDASPNEVVICLGQQLVGPREFCPDTNITDAWRVVEKMRDREPTVCLYDGLWTVGMHRSADENDIEEHVHWDSRSVSHDRARVFIKHENVCIAICIAALRACGVSEDRIEQARKESV